MSSKPCTFYLKNACNRGSLCTFSHQKPISGTKSPICPYFLMGTCVFGNRCQSSHKGDVKETNADCSYDKGSSNLHESPMENEIARSDKGSAGEGEDVQDSLPSGQVLDLPRSEEIDVDDGYADPEVRDDDLLSRTPSNITVGEENADNKGTCVFFPEGSCGNGSGCDFSHSIPKDTGIASSGRRKGPKSESPMPKPSDSPRKKVCKHYRQGHCQSEKECKFLHPPQHTKSPMETPEASTDLSCRLDSPLDRPNGEEDDNKTLLHHPHEFEEDTMVYDDKMDQRPSYSDDEFNRNHPEPFYNDETYQEQIDNGPSNSRHTDNADSQVVEETYVNHVEPIEKSFKTSKRASYYGDGWEERSSPRLATQLPASERAALPVVPSSKYPHVSEVIPHWTQFADPHTNKDVPFCKRLAQGGCSQGDRCRFRHSLTVEEYILLFNDQQPNLWTLQRNGVNEAAVSSPVLAQPQVDSPHISSTVVVRSSTFGLECKFYPIGKCHNGDLCPFQHTQHPVAPAAVVLNPNQDWQTSDRRAFGTQNSQRPCKYYLERGYCSRGLSCKFSHGDHPSSGPSGPESTPSVVDDDKGWSTGKEEGNKGNNASSEADTPAEDNGWGAVATRWDEPSNLEDHSAWYSPSGNDHSYQSRPRKSNVCFQYTEGRCRRGEACKFSHDQEIPSKPWSSETPKTEDGRPPTDDSSHSAIWNTAPPAQCPYYLKGNCRNGSFCHMSHDPQEESQPAESYKADQPTNELREIIQNEAQSTLETEGEPKTLSKSPPKAQEGDSQDSHILANEASWSEPWPTGPSPPSFPIKFDAPCKRFGQGYCPFGDDCTYLHIEDTDVVEHTSSSEGDVSKFSLANDDVTELEPDSSTTIEPEPIIFDHPVVERHILNCTVSFGIDVTPDQITTAADSKKLILFNIPIAVSPTDIRELAEPSGEIRSIMSLDETEHTAMVEVEFAESSQALTAFKLLNGHLFGSHAISANLKGRISMSVRSSEHTHVVKVSWPAPSASAWIHYTTISKAKSEAIRLDGVIVGGLQIKAVSVPPLKRQKTSFAVEIRGLPLDVSKDVLMDLCPEQFCITLNHPCYTQDATSDIRSALTRCGELEDIDILASASRLTTIVAFAMFKSAETALKAMEALDGHNQDFLGGQPLSVRPVYYFRHRATISQFDAVKNEIDRLNDQGEKKCSIQYQELHGRSIVWIRIHASAENLAMFASLNTELATLLRGMLLISNGDVVWDDYLETSSSAKFIDNINTANSEGPFFVQCDSRTKNIRIFGAKSDQERAQKLVMRMLQKVHKLRYEIQFPRTKLRGLVNGGLTALQDDMGANKVLLDVANAKLIVRGTSDDNSKVEDYINSLDSVSTPETTEALCEICHHLPFDPIFLTCRHAYCTLCLQMALRYSPSAPFQCISRDTLEGGLTTQCPANVPYVVIRDILPNEEKKFLHESFLSYVRSTSSEFFFCPTLDCQSVYRTGVEGLTLKCFKCVSEICSFCHTRAHVGIACKENKI